MRDEYTTGSEAGLGDLRLYDYVARQFAVILAKAGDEPRHQPNRHPVSSQAAVSPQADYTRRPVMDVIPEPAEELQDLFSRD